MICDFCFSELRNVEVHEINELCVFPFHFVSPGVVSRRQLSEPWRSSPPHSQVSESNRFPWWPVLLLVRANSNCSLQEQTFYCLLKYVYIWYMAEQNIKFPFPFYSDWMLRISFSEECVGLDKRGELPHWLQTSLSCLPKLTNESAGMRWTASKLQHLKLPVSHCWKDKLLWPVWVDQVSIHSSIKKLISHKMLKLGWMTDDVEVQRVLLVKEKGLWHPPPPPATAGWTHFLGIILQEVKSMTNSILVILPFSSILHAALPFTPPLCVCCSAGR